MATKSDALTSIRAIAAFLVLFDHSWNRYFGDVIRLPTVFGAIGVSFFFLLSGFIMCYAYAGEGELNTRRFYRRRLARIMPVYILAMMVTLLVESVFLKTPPNASPAAQVFLYVTTLHAWLPGIPRINAPSWSIAAEMFFYLLFPLLLPLLKRKRRGFIVLTVLLFILSQTVRFYLAHISASPFDINAAQVFPLLRLNEFMVGMVGYWLYLKYDAFPRVWFVFGPAIAIVLLGGLYPSLFKTSFFAPFLLLMLLSIAKHPPAILSCRFFVYLGAVSYGIYILHWPMFGLAGVLLTGYPPQMPFIAGIVFTLIVAGLSYRFVEQPLRNLLSGNHNQ